MRNLFIPVHLTELNTYEFTSKFANWKAFVASAARNLQTETHPVDLWTVGCADNPPLRYVQSCGQPVENASRFPPPAHRSALAHKLHRAQFIVKHKIWKSQKRLPATEKIELLSSSTDRHLSIPRISPATSPVRRYRH